MRVYREDALMNMPFDGAKLTLFVGSALVVILRDDDPAIPWPNHWDFPGGGREGDETPKECVLRETYEELGLSINPDLITWGKRTKYPAGDKWFFVAHVPAELAAKIELGDEGQKWRLMSPEEYFEAPNNIPRLAEQLRLYLVGNVGDL